MAPGSELLTTFPRGTYNLPAAVRSRPQNVSGVIASPARIANRDCLQGIEKLLLLGMAGVDQMGNQSRFHGFTSAGSLPS